MTDELKILFTMMLKFPGDNKQNIRAIMMQSYIQSFGPLPNEYGDLFKKFLAWNEDELGMNKVEAIKRMIIHDLPIEVINRFLADEVMISDQGMLRECTEKEKKMIEEYEQESGCYVYHLIHAIANIGETYEFLRVSNYVEDWDYENDGLDKGEVLVHSVNVTHPNWSESGTIFVKRKDGNDGLTRIG